MTTAAECYHIVNSGGLGKCTIVEVHEIAFCLGIPVCGMTDHAKLINWVKSAVACGCYTLGNPTDPTVEELAEAAKMSLPQFMELVNKIAADEAINAEESF